MHVALAGIRVSLEGLSEELAPLVAARFAGATHGKPQPVDVALTFAPVAVARFDVAVPPSDQQPFLLEHHGDRVVVGTRVVRGWCDATHGALEIVSRADHRETVGGVENVLRVVAARTALARGGLLLHSAAIASEAEGSAIVLVGRSGAGKSTASTTAKQLGRRVLSDELNLLEVAGADVFVRPVPFAGDHGEPPSDARYRLRALFLLEQAAPGTRDAVRAVSRARAAGALVAAAPFVNTDAARTDALLARALALVDASPTRALSLTLGADAWAVARSEGA